MNNIPKISPGDVLVMKKTHPCGKNEFRVLRIGSDVRFVCLGCGRDVTVQRIKLEKSIRRIIPKEDENDKDQG